jgi:DNA-binding beta-propeller fold protein YncE
MRQLSILVLIAAMIISCKKNDDSPNGTFLTGDGVFVINEGNFMGGNGSLSFFSYDSAKIYNDLFGKVNGRPLGDVPNSMELYGDKAYIVVNNSGKIEIIRKSTLESVSTITGIISPRNIAFPSSTKAYVTSMYSDSLIVINLNNNSISGYINLRRTSEAIVITGEKAFIANWVGGHEIMVVNTATDAVVDSIAVGAEPESMVLDKDNILWVLCNGGWLRDNFAELDGINTATDEMQKHLVFPTKEESPVCLKIDGKGENLFFLDSGVRKMNISSSEIPTDPFITESGHFFYKLAVSPANSDVYVTDAVDYQQNGYLLNYTVDGVFKSSYETDIIPASMCFKISAK